MWVYLDIIVPRIIYEQKDSMKEAIELCISHIFSSTLALSGIFCMICWIGHIYVKAEV